MPGGIILIAAAVLLQSGMLTLSAPLVSSSYYIAFGAGILLAWRFDCARVLFALLVLLLAHHGLEFFAAGRAVSLGPGRIAFEAVSLLIPLDFLLVALRREEGLGISAIAPYLGVLFVESVFVAVLCRPGEMASPAFLHPGLLNRHWFLWTKIPQLDWLAFGIALALLFLPALLARQPLENGLLWALCAALLSLQTGGVGKIPSAYMAVAALILAVTLIENSYLLAYHDELTALPGRRAFNDALRRLGQQFVIAAVDIDHFKLFNDTHGHETGDEVLRMIAAKLARVGGGGTAYRIGGEEFSILFPGKIVDEVVPHLERLRAEIASSAFRPRHTQDRRRIPRPQVDRRKPARRRQTQGPTRRSPGHTLSLSISIGVAEASAKTKTPGQVLQAADKALYRAKDAGRNRVEVAGQSRVRPKIHIA